MPRKPKIFIWAVPILFGRQTSSPFSPQVSSAKDHWILIVSTLELAVQGGDVVPKTCFMLDVVFWVSSFWIAPKRASPRRWWISQKSTKCSKREKTWCLVFVCCCNLKCTLYNDASMRWPNQSMQTLHRVGKVYGKYSGSVNKFHKSNQWPWLFGDRALTSYSSDGWTGSEMTRR